MKRFTQLSPSIPKTARKRLHLPDSRLCGCWFLILTLCWQSATFLPVTAETPKALTATGTPEKTARGGEPGAVGRAQVNPVPVTTVSAASYETTAIAPDSIVAAFGTKLATRVQAAETLPLPVTLAGTTVRVTDSAGVERLAPLFFVSVGQVNYLVPSDTAPGTAIVTVQSGDGTISQGSIQVFSAAPSLFSANADGQGVPAASVLRVRASGEQVYEPVFEETPAGRRPRAIDPGPEGEKVFLVLYLTGIRRAPDPNRDGNASESVRVIIGGSEVVPAYAGPQGGFVGLDQVNVEIPRSLIGRGRLTLTVGGTGFSSTNPGEIEIAGLQGSTPPQITALSSSSVLAGQELTITGAGFSATAGGNLVRIGGTEAPVRSAQSSQLTVTVPFGAESGRVTVRTSSGEAASAAALAVRTSVSGIVETTSRQPLRGVVVRITGTNLSATTDAEGSFLLPDVTPGTVLLEIDGEQVATTAKYPKVVLRREITAGRDNLLGQPVALQAISNAGIDIGAAQAAGGDETQEPRAQVAAVQAGEVSLEIPVGTGVTFPDGSTSGRLSLTVVSGGRTPARLPAGQFSSSIVQITPFGATLDTGGKLVFPNSEGLAAGTQARLYRFEQRAENAARGTFVEAGQAVVSADGLRIETADGSVTETGYYFVSGTRQTTAITGRVTENGAPVRRVLVRARGQEAFTDGNGGFILRGVPVSADDQLTVEASYLRAGRRVERIQREKVAATVNGITKVTPDLALPGETVDRPPVILAPTSFRVTAGETSDISLIASDPEGQAVQVSVTGAAFASVIARGNNAYALHLTPAPGDARDQAFALVITATDGQNAASQSLALSVLPPPPSITNLSPQNGRPGTVVTITGVSLRADSGTPGVGFVSASGRRIPALVTSASATEVKVTVPNGARSGSLELTNNLGRALSGVFTVDPSQNFSLSVSPSSADAMQGTSATFIVSVTSPDAGFTQLASLSVEGLPQNVRASFSPANITADASSTLSLVLPGNLSAGSYSLTLKGKARIDGSDVERTAGATLTVLTGGRTTLSGRVLSTRNEPLPGATVSLDGQSATTDASGAFLLTGITAGKDRPVMVNGRSASGPGRTYPVINEPVTIIAGQANEVPYTFYLPLIAVENEQPVMPDRETVITTPEAPGLALRIPASAGLQNRDGSAVARVSLSCVEIDRTPAPLPAGVATNMVYTAQPGGTRPALRPDGTRPVMPVSYPNLAGANPGTRIELWNFNHDRAEWYVYGYGRVSADGKTIQPEPGVGLPDFSWHFPRTGSGDGPPPPGSGSRGGRGGGSGGGGGGDCKPGDPCCGGGGGGGGGFGPGGGSGSSGPFTPFTVADSSSSGAGGESSSGGFLGASSYTANPVDLSTGIKYEMATDIAFSGARGGLSLTRIYTTNLASLCDGCPFGRGMTHNYTIRLTGTFLEGGAGRVVQPWETDGRLFSYARKESDGTLVFNTTGTPGQLGDILRKLPGGTFEYRYKYGGLLLFDAAGRATAAVDRNGNRTTLEYTGGSLFRITDPAGRAITLEYTGGRISSARDPLNRVWRYTYDSGGRLKTVTDPLSFTVSYEYDIFSRLVSVTDRRGIVMKKVTYDAAGRVSRQEFADGSWERYDYTVSGRVITGAQITDSLGRTQQRRFNASGYVIGMADELGQTAVIRRNMVTNLPEEIIGPCGCTESKRTYDDNGNLRILTDRHQKSTEFDYHPVFNNLTQIKDRLGRISKWGYDNRGNLISYTDALGRMTIFTPDSFGQIRSIEDPLHHKTTIDYDDSGFPRKVTDALANETLYEFDSAGRLKKATDAEQRVASISYDDNDRVTSVTDPAGIKTTYEYDQNGNLKKITNSRNKAWNYDYDLRNRLIRETDSLGQAMQYRYDTDNELTAIVSALGRIIRYEYDARGQVQKITDPNGGEILFTYDRVRQLTSVRDQRGSLTTFSYDDLYRRESVLDPLGRKTSYRYDDVGNLTEITDRLNRRIIIRPDPLNRPETVTYQDAVVTYKFDEAYRIKRIDDVSASDAQPGFIEWTYDEANRLKSEITPAGVVRYEYNRAGQRRSMTAADRPPVNYGYDPAGRLKTITQGTEVFTWGYDDLSRMARLERPNNVTTAYQYDDANRLSRLSHTNASGVALEDFQYSYNADDEIEAITSIASPQLLPVTKGVGIADAANRIRQFGEAGYSYDDEGQTISKTDGQGTTLYLWDARGRLVKATLPNGQTVSYGYDALGRRATRTAGNITTLFLFDGLDVVLDRTDRGQPVDYLNGAGIDQKLRQGPVGNGFYFLTDHLDSTSLLTSATGAVIERTQYEPFGAGTSGLLTRYGYTGRELDPASGLVYYRKRWFDPQQGRFLSEDPVGFDGGSNFYSYVGNSPQNFIDPLGLGPWGQAVGGGIGAVVGGAAGFVGGGIIGGAEGAGAGTLALPVGGTVVGGVAGAGAGAWTGAAWGGLAGLGAGAAIGDRIGDWMGGFPGDWPGGMPGNWLCSQNEGRKPPFQGIPGSTSSGDRQTRRYGPDGYPDVDVDTGHDHNGAGDPHAHDWGRPPNGGPPTHNDRSPARPLRPGDPPSPRNRP